MRLDRPDFDEHGGPSYLGNGDDDRSFGLGEARFVSARLRM